MPRCNIEHNLAAAQAQHAGLWFEKYTRHPTETKQHSQHIADTAAIAEPSIYAAWFAGWQAALASAGVITKRANCLGRLSVGLGNENVIETGITLQRTYGMPYIPGSALKGLAASYARKRLGAEWREGGNGYRVLFGYASERQGADVLSQPEAETDTGAAGYITFFDAHYLPGSGKDGHALHADVVTVHHQEYYNSAKQVAPADWDAPNPVPFLTATGDYLLALAGPPIWVNAAYQILAYALVEYGVGAKTNAGYGRMMVEGFETLALLSAADSAANRETVPPPPVNPEQALVDDFIRRLAALSTLNVAGQMNTFYQEWKALDVSAGEKKRSAQAIVQKVVGAGREKASREKNWYIEVKTVADS